MLVSTSILSSIYKEKDLIKEINESDCDYVHLDIMDGAFVKNKTWTIGEIHKLSKIINKKLDIHLMVKNPKKYIEAFSLLNASYITFHIEAVENVNEIIDLIKSYGIKPGICIKPKTNVEEVFPYLDLLGQVLIMSVEPGASGQMFNEIVLDKVKILREEINKRNSSTIISIDGGINTQTGLLAKEAGVDMLVSASFIHESIKENTSLLHNI